MASPLPFEDHTTSIVKRSCLLNIDQLPYQCFDGQPRVDAQASALVSSILVMIRSIVVFLVLSVIAWTAVALARRPDMRSPCS